MPSFHSRLILASASPRRKVLLKQAGITFDVLPSNVDESNVENRKPTSYARLLAEKKATAVAHSHPNAYVIGADTIVVIDGRILGKPGSVSEAREMLKSLSAKNHDVITGFAIQCLNRNINLSETVTTAVSFKFLTEDEIEWYLNTKEPFDKAGGYAIQGRGAFMVKHLHGSYTNVVGLPMSELIETLTRLDLTPHLRKQD